MEVVVRSRALVWSCLFILINITCSCLFMFAQSNSTQEEEQLLAVDNINNDLPSGSSKLLPNSYSYGNMISQFLGPQNMLRSQLGLPPLRWSEPVAQYARWWAGQRWADCALEHSGTERYGENIFWGWGKAWTPADAVAAWASEKRFYSHSANSCNGGECLHYTQMVWTQTSRVGCVTVVCRNGGTFITCNYDPPGNIIGQKPY